MRVSLASAFAALVSILSVADANSQGISIAKVLENVRRQQHAADFRAEGRLVRVAEQGLRTAYRFTCKGKFFAATFKCLWQITDPASASVRLLIEAPDGGQPRIRVAATDSKINELKPDQWGDSFLDSGLAYEDLVERQFSWREQILVKEDKYGARTCFVVQSQPGPGEHSIYSLVTSWVDRDTYVPVYVEKTLRKSGIKKQFLYYGIQQSKGTWGARQVEVRVEGSSVRTLLIVTRGSGKANLSRSDFDPGVLTSHTLGMERRSPP